MVPDDAAGDYPVLPDNPFDVPGLPQDAGGWWHPSAPKPPQDPHLAVTDLDLRQSDERIALAEELLAAVSFAIHDCETHQAEYGHVRIRPTFLLTPPDQLLDQLARLFPEAENPEQIAETVRQHRAGAPKGPRSIDHKTFEAELLDACRKIITTRSLHGKWRGRPVTLLKLAGRLHVGRTTLNAALDQHHLPHDGNDLMRELERRELEKRELPGHLQDKFPSDDGSTKPNEVLHCEGSTSTSRRPRSMRSTT